MGNIGIFGEDLRQFRTPRRQIVTLVEHHAGAPQIAHGFRCALAIGSVRQNQNLAVFWNKRPEHGLDGICAGPLDRDAVVISRIGSDDRQKTVRMSRVNARKSLSQLPQSFSIACLTSYEVVSGPGVRR